MQVGNFAKLSGRLIRPECQMLNLNWAFVLRSIINLFRFQFLVFAKQKHYFRCSKLGPVYIFKNCNFLNKWYSSMQNLLRYFTQSSPGSDGNYRQHPKLAKNMEINQWNTSNLHYWLFISVKLCSWRCMRLFVWVCWLNENKIV